MNHDSLPTPTTSGSTGNSQEHDQTQTDFFGPPIHTYSRKQALADGMQVDVSITAREAGFKIPVFITTGVFENYVRVTEGVECQDEAGRLWDVLWMLFSTIRRSAGNTDRTNFKLFVRNNNSRPRLVTLTAVCGALDFDDPAPCITIMLPNEN